MQHTPAPAATPSFYLKRHAQVVQTLALVGAALLLVQPVLLLTASNWLDLFGIGSFLGLPNLPPDEAGRWRTAVVSLLPVGGGLYALRLLPGGCSVNTARAAYSAPPRKTRWCASHGPCCCWRCCCRWRAA